MKRLLAAALACALAAPAAAGPRNQEIRDPDTRAWWRLTDQLSSDAMEGRDTGSGGYDRAAAVVAARFKAAGLKPAGDDGGWYQTFLMHEAWVQKNGASIAVVGDDGATTELPFLREVSVRAADDLPHTLDAPLAYRGYCRPQDMTGVAGKMVICINTRRAGLTTGAERIKAAQAAGAVGLVHVDDIYFTIEPPRWPAAYARTLSLADDPPPKTGGFAVLTTGAVGFRKLLAGSGRDPDRLMQLGGTKQPLPAFDPPARLKARFLVWVHDFPGKNVLGVLPGASPRRKAEHLVISAHLDGYGYGEPVGGDSLYNGTLDDAAYVATLVRFAERRDGVPMARSVVFAAFAGEEKGLLGARWFTRHPTVPKASIVADINLDQLRPLFPLELMTVLAVDESTLGDDVRAVAGSMGVRVQPDPEPERGLLQRADHWPFMQIGVPATGFIFGYRPGTEAERRYRHWYDVQYHRPQDDPTQPMDFRAAAKFNSFFYKLVERVANARERPRWKPGSRYAPQP